VYLDEPCDNKEIEEPLDSSYMGTLKRRASTFYSAAGTKASGMKETASQKLETSGVKDKVSSTTGKISENAKFVGGVVALKAGSFKDSAGVKLGAAKEFTS
jgi:hypothetical protein